MQSCNKSRVLRNSHPVDFMARQLRVRCLCHALDGSFYRLTSSEINSIVCFLSYLSDNHSDKNENKSFRAKVISLSIEVCKSTAVCQKYCNHWLLCGAWSIQIEILQISRITVTTSQRNVKYANWDQYCCFSCKKYCNHFTTECELCKNTAVCQKYCNHWLHNGTGIFSPHNQFDSTNQHVKKQCN